MFLGLLLLGCLAAPPATLTAEAGNLNGRWRFQIDPADRGEAAAWFAPEFDDHAWRELQVPGGWEEQGVTDPRPGQPPKVDPRLRYTDYDGVAWYRLSFVIPAGWGRQELVLRLGLVDDQDRTWFNGRLVGATGPGRANPSTIARRYPIPAELVRPGAVNVLTVRVLDQGGPGGLLGPDVTLLPRAPLETGMTLPSPDRPLAARFANPPGAARILKIVHGWPDDAQQQDELLATLLDRGFGGVVCNVSFQDYLVSEAHWQAFERAVERAHAHGMALWVYDEKGYPSCNAGGLTLRDHPEWRAHGLLVARAESRGGPVELKLPPGRLMLAQARPASGQPVDLTPRVQGDHLTWTAPAGTWTVLAITEGEIYEGTHAAGSLSEHQPYPNLLQPEPTKRFIELTHDAYLKRLGPDRLRWFASTFTDEPSLMSLFLKPMPYEVLPWAANLPGEFQRRHGYDLLPHLASLAADAPGATQVRLDFWTTVGELVSDNFFGQLRDWCAAHGLASGGHLLMEESTAGHVPLYGDFFRCLRALSAPSIDCLTSLPPEVPWKIAKYVGSAADLDGHRLTMCETSDHVQRFRAPGDTRPVRVVTEDEVRGTCQKLILGGVNTITSYYSYAGLSTAQIRALNLTIGRTTTLLTGGHQVTDIAVVDPVHSVQAAFLPARHGASNSPAVRRIEAVFDGVSRDLYTARRDYTFIDAPTLAAATVAGGELRYRELAWRVVVLPAIDTLPATAWAKLAEFAQSGGVVIAVGARPLNSTTECPSPTVKALGKALFGDGAAGVHANAAGGGGIYLAPGAEGLLRVVVDAVVGPDVAARQAHSALRVAHRRVDDADVWYLINDSPEPLRDTVTLAAAGAGARYLPDSGAIEPLASGRDVPLELGAYRGVLLRFATAVRPPRRPLVTGPLPGLTLEPLALGTPQEGHATDVQAVVQPAGSGWRFVGTLTRAGVDTFLFSTYRLPAGVDLSRTRYLVFDLSTPPQATATAALVIVKTRDGGEFLAPTGRALGQAGQTTIYLPWERLQKAGWSKAGATTLDLSQLAEIRIGWGGYFGLVGERIEFSVSGLAAGGEQEAGAPERRPR